MTISFKEITVGTSYVPWFITQCFFSYTRLGKLWQYHRIIFLSQKNGEKWKTYNQVGRVCCSFLKNWEIHYYAHTFSKSTSSGVFTFWGFLLAVLPADQISLPPVTAVKPVSLSPAVGQIHFSLSCLLSQLKLVCMQLWSWHFGHSLREAQSTHYTLVHQITNMYVSDWRRF